MEQKQVTPEDHHVVIRNAERQDVPLLLEFIRGIARFAKMEDEVIASADELEQDQIICINRAQNKQNYANFQLFSEKYANYERFFVLLQKLDKLINITKQLR